ncbi:hypothetical protein E4U19_001223 [Claviceps sp. Clav32 group G5]|nr:hypothetical protein E4U19_001223 [Claviceps sp. Clav32 group G5]
MVVRLDLRRSRQASDEFFSDYFSAVRGADGKNPQLRRGGGGIQAPGGGTESSRASQPHTHDCDARSEYTYA